jgi:hypothetical protein
MKIQLQTFIQPKVTSDAKVCLTKLIAFISVFLIFHSSYAQPDFFADKTTIHAGDTVQFTDFTTEGSFIITSYSWTFSIPGVTTLTSTQKNPRMVFLDKGVYDVTQIVYFGFGPQIKIRTNYLTVNDGSVGNDNAALVDMIGPKMVDPGVYTAKVKLRNRGENKINNVTINWELNGVLQTPIFWTSPLDTIKGIGSMDAIVPLGSVTLSVGSALSLKAWTSYPNGMPDSQTSNDTITFMLRPKLAGNYTIGGVNPDFITIKDAVRGLKSDYGIAGQVVFNIRTGTYIENVTIDSLKGTSSVNTVLFKSEGNDSSLVTITYAPVSLYDNYTIVIKNTNYISFKYLTINSTGTTLGRAFSLVGNTSFLSIENCCVSATSNPMSSNSNAIWGDKLTGSDLLLKNNLFIINGPVSGLLLKGKINLLLSRLLIDSNHFNVISCCNWACDIQLADAPKFRYNTMLLLPPGTCGAGGAGGAGGVEIVNSKNALEASYNKIKGINVIGNLIGIAIGNCHASSIDYAKVFNNEIVLNGVGRLFNGLTVSASNIEIAHNSIHTYSVNISTSLWSDNSTAGFGPPFDPPLTPDTIIIRNNVFSNTGSGYMTCALNVVDSNRNIYSDYNLLYADSATGMLIARGPSFSGPPGGPFVVTNPLIAYTLNSYRAAHPGKERNSQTYRPAFKSRFDLSPDISDTACWLMNGMGTQTTISKDIDGSPRPTSILAGAPDVGAYEFSPAVRAPMATPQPPIALPGQTQAFTYGSTLGSDTIAIIEWDSNWTPPVTIDLVNYTDSAIAPYPNQYQLRSFLDVRMTGSGTYLYNLKYRYRTPLLGNILNEQNLIAAKQVTSVWLPYNLGTTVLDTFNNTMKVSALTDDVFHFTGTHNNHPLRVRLITFDAKLHENDVLLEWSTASETNSRGFEVERSEDGRTFSYVGFVKGAGNSTDINKYNFADESVFDKTNGNTLYYRLKQIDTDAEYTYSQTVHVNKFSESIHSISIAPNPYTDVFIISFNSTRDYNARVEVVDLRGKVVLIQNNVVTKGQNTMTVKGAEHLKSGIYFVRLNINDETQVLKLVKN